MTYPAQHNFTEHINAYVKGVRKVKEIILNRCHIAVKSKLTLVDDEDFELLNKYNWCQDSNGYVVSGRGKELLRMHRVIMNTPFGLVTDHIDGNKLNNQKSNLRICTCAQNGRNRSSSYTYKGVYVFRNKFQSSIKLNKKAIHLGTFNTEIEAAIAYNKAAIIYHGEYAKLNII
jgi:hypothetical protein